MNVFKSVPQKNVDNLKNRN